jgi:hypothetical protein
MAMRLISRKVERLVVRYQRVEILEEILGKALEPRWLKNGGLTGQAAEA